MSNLCILIKNFISEAHLFTTVYIKFWFGIDGRKSIAFLYVICLALWPTLIYYLFFTSFKSPLLQSIGYLEKMTSIQIALEDGARIEN